MRRTEWTLRERIADIKDDGEISGFESRMQLDGRLTDEVRNLLAMRREEIRKAGGRT